MHCPIQYEWVFDISEVFFAVEWLWLLSASFAINTYRCQVNVYVLTFIVCNKDVLVKY